ncbi:carbohydrate ABC transporter permease [Microbacterium sp. AK031]|uniref:carbohydrate ABC transporter permease n=1 Tax=Microbacterium sp. AK031 TaxID=2723076 RepID=UPI002169DDB7|nr:sugar ABC transporter permease [Microbacterium sp. AK031]MCS3845058.1 sorbitol/mannitol transport system permease protein [Microbacterium sp. AK031]
MTQSSVSEARKRPTQATPPASGASRRTSAGKQSLWGRVKFALPLYPAMIVVLLVSQLPFVLTLWYSLNDWNLATSQDGPEFVGLANYAEIFTEPEFLQAAGNTAIMTVGAVAASFIIGLLLALLVNREFRGRGIVRTLLIIPFLVLPAATALLWKNTMFGTSYGILNWVIGLVGIPPVDWLGEFPMLSVIIILTWQWSPFFMLILLAGLQSEDPSTIEAAKVDGAGAFTRFRHLTWRHLRPYSELSVVLGSIYIIQTFDAVYLAAQGSATTNLPYYLYQRAFRGLEIGQASAMAVIVLFVTLIIASIGLRVASNLLKSTEGRAS